MWFHVLLALVAIDLCDHTADAQCYNASIFCEGAIDAASSFDDCCRPVVASNNLERSFSTQEGYNCFACIVLGLNQSQYTFSERNVFYNLRLRLLSSSTTLLLGRPRLRLLGVPGTAGVDDFRVMSSDILITSASGLNVAVTISDDGIAGEPMENFTITSQQPLVIGSFDAPFLFRDSVVNIIDSDEPTYQFDQGDYVTTEGPNARIRVVVQQIVQSVRDIHLLLTPLTYAEYIARSNQPGSTLAPISRYHESRPSNAHYEDDRQDFDKTVRRVFFAANSGANAERRVDFPVFDDVVNEESEGFIIVLDVDRNLTDFAVAFTPNLRTTLGKILDEDPFFFGFEQEEHVYNERRDEGTQDIIYSPAPGNRTEKTFTFALNLNRDQGAFTFGSNGDISFGSNIIRPTFIFVGTLPPTSPPVRFISFRLNDDNILEGQEIGLLTIAPSTFFNGFVPRFQSVRIIINNSNSASVTLDAPLIVPEQNRSFLATISLTEPSGGTTISLEININDIGITATPFSDYIRLAPTSVVFQGVNRPGCCVRTVLYRVTDDNIAEPDEILTLSIVRSLYSNQIPVEYLVQRVNVTIVDNDMATIGFENISVSVQEDAGLAVLYVAVLNGALGGDVTVRYSTADLSATELDYNSTTRILTFSRSRTRIAVQVPIRQDHFTELLEQFHASLSLVNDNGINMDVNPDQATVNIIDDDSVIIGFVEDLVTVNEADMFASLTVRILSGSLVQGASALVGFSTADASAQSPGDYRSVSQQLNFTSSDTEYRITISIINDILVEDVEQFIANLNLISAAGRVTINPPRATVNIRSNDRLTIGFAAQRYGGQEGLSAVLVVHILSGVLAPGLSVPVIFTTINFQAVAPGDYTPTTQVLQFSSVNSSLDVTVPLRLDFFYEAVETFFGYLQLQSTPLDVIVDPSCANLSINDNNRVEIGFRVADVMVPVSAGGASLTVELIGAQLNTTVQIQFNTTDGTAIAGSDYNSNSGTITFTPGATIQTIRIPIINDRRLENNEIFTVHLSNAPIRVTLNPDQATVTIIDDNRAIIGFENISVSVQEGTGVIVVFVAVLNGTLGRDVNVQFSTADLSATAGADYNSTTRILTFNGSLSRIGVLVPIILDEFTELNEQFRATLSLVDDKGISVHPNQSTVVIINDDRVIIGFVEDSVTVNEPNMLASLTVKIFSGFLEPGTTALMVGFSTVDASAQSPGDYNSVSQQLNFTSSVTEYRVNISIVNDIVVEAVEQLFGNLNLISAVDSVSINPPQATVNIHSDDRLMIGFSAPSYSGLEGMSVQPVVRILSGVLATGLSVPVLFSTTNFQALTPGDYTTTREVHLFNASLTVPVPLQTDSVYEAVEIFFADLQLQTSPLNVVIDPVASRADLLIIDNNRVNIGFRVADVLVPVDAEEVILTVELTGAQLNTNIQIQFRTADGTAIAGIDYNSTSGTITFTPGTTIQTIKIPIVNDRRFENNETFTVLLSNAPTRVTLSPDQATVTIIDDNTPRSVKNFHVVNVKVSACFITWKAQSSTSEPAVLYYTITHNVTESGSVETLNTTALNITLGGASAGHTYLITVYAVNGVGAGMSTSGTCTVVPMITVPSSVIPTIVITTTKLLASSVTTTTGEGSSCTATIINPYSTSPSPLADQFSAAYTNVAVAAVVSGVLSAVGTAVVTSIITWCVVVRCRLHPKSAKPAATSPSDGEKPYSSIELTPVDPDYDVPVFKDQHMFVEDNVAYDKQTTLQQDDV